MRTALSTTLAAIALLAASPGLSQGFLAVVAGDGYAQHSTDAIEWLLCRDVLEDTVVGLTAQQVATDPDFHFQPIAAGDLVWLSLGGHDVLAGRTQSEIQGDLLTVISRFLAVPWTSVVHVGGSHGFPDVSAQTRLVLETLWPGRYEWVDLRHLDQEPLVHLDPADPLGLHLTTTSYELRVGDVLGWVSRLGIRP